MRGRGDMGRGREGTHGEGCRGVRWGHMGVDGSAQGGYDIELAAHSPVGASGYA